MRASQGLTFSSPTLEGIDDFNGLYVPQLVQMSHGLVPYRDFAYSYPPLFLMVLYPFYIIGGSNFAAVPIIIADAATAPLLYLIVQSLAGKRLGLAAALVYALSPFALYYESYVWFSSQPMTFFAVLGAYFFMRNKPMWSFSSLAIAILFKQEAVFMIPVLVLMFGYRDRRKMLVGLSALFAILAAVSLPFLIISFHGYLQLVTYGLLGKWTGAPSVESVPGVATCQNIFSNALGSSLSCAFGSTTYSEFITNDGFLALLYDRFSFDLNILSGFVAVPLFLLVMPILYGLRRRSNFCFLLAAWTWMGFLIIFSIVFHQAFKYYYLPVYALLFTVVVDRRTLVVAASTSILSLVTPSGAFQEVLPILGMLALMIMLDSSSKKLDLSVFRESSTMVSATSGSDRG